jgi:FkbM family methyltransferase
MNWKFYGQFDPPVDKFIFNRYFPDPDIRGIYVECGAFDGQTECSCRFFEESLSWTGLNLEPVPHLFEALQTNRPTGRNLNLGLSSSCGSATFSHAISPIVGRAFGNGSINHFQSHRDQLVASGCTFEEMTIQVITWSRLVEQERLHHVDLFVLDVEGHELDVLNGMKGCSILPDVMAVEFGHIGFDVVRKAMSDLGYDYDICSHGNAFFIHHDKLALFAIRRAAMGSRTLMTMGPIGEEDVVATLTQQNVLLQKRNDELTSLLQSIVGSRSWRWLEFMKRLLGRGKPIT